MTLQPLRKTLVLILVALPLACGGSGIANMKKGTKVTVSGEIDNIIHTELPYEKEMLSVTAVGFTSGQSIALIGLHPGLNKGKRIKVQAEFFENIRGTDVFRAIQISTEAPTEPRSP
ncbi:MAG: hypothetical protein AB1451_12215 [Nitrospirota bacterium]